MKMSKTKAIGIVLIITATIKSIGIENIPFPVTVVTLAVLIIGLFVLSFKYEMSKEERIILIVMDSLLALIITIIIIGTMIQDNYPQISVRCKPIIVTVLAILSIILLGVIVFNAVYKIKHNKL
ncbi:hypothetical protein [Clostridium felsineum]|uniref:Uncharacterized protein n=1 Tax=Clostridium felsineum TaxID=36839 RepID=A0A1S8L2L2_9CLOT|nr:hypothetical protein [Clostridium felsineum]URZ05303.1 hypothetical protein CLROS_006270 [Clostridium felsineum]URZ10344.1 hypothetical protein CROST_010520 [Clostridium felsineum]